MYRRWSEEDILQLIDTIYSASLEVDRWQAVMDSLATFIPDGRAAVATHDAKSGLIYGETGLFLAGFSDRFLPDYIAHYDKSNAWIDRSMGTDGRGPPMAPGAYADWEFLDRPIIEQTEYFNDSLIPEAAEAAACTILFNEVGRSSTVSLMGKRRLGKDIIEDARDLLGIITPHLRRALQINRQFGDLELTAQISETVLDKVSAATFVVDDTCRLRFANRSARQIMEGDKTLSINSYGQIKARAASLTAKLHRHIAAATSRQAFFNRSGGFVILRSKTGQAWPAMVAPLRLDRQDREKNFYIGPDDAPLAFIFLPTPKHASREYADLLILRYELTNAEAKLALALSEGLSLSEYSVRNGVTLNTVRTHLKRVFNKTHTRRQGELVAEIKKLVAGFTVVGD